MFATRYCIYLSFVAADDISIVHTSKIGFLGMLAVKVKNICTETFKYQSISHKLISFFLSNHGPWMFQPFGHLGCF